MRRYHCYENHLDGLIEFAMKVILRDLTAVICYLEDRKREERMYWASKSSYYNFRSGDARIAAKTKAFYGKCV